MAIVIPALNEFEGIAQTISRCKLALPQAKVYVIGGLSTDGTDDIAQQSGATIIRCLKPGKSAAIKKAFKSIDADILCMLDADGTYPPEDFPNLINTMEDFKCDAVVGTRISNGPRTINYYGNFFLTHIANFLHGFINHTDDLTSGMWVFRRHAYKSIVIDSQGFELETNLFVEMNRRRLLLGGVQIPYGKRLGKSKLNKFDGVKILWYLIRKRIGL